MTKKLIQNSPPQIKHKKNINPTIHWRSVEERAFLIYLILMRQFFLHKGRKRVVKNNYIKMASFVRTRTSEQCRTHFNRKIRENKEVDFDLSCFLKINLDMLKTELRGDIETVSSFIYNYVEKDNQLMENHSHLLKNIEKNINEIDQYEMKLDENNLEAKLNKEGSCQRINFICKIDREANQIYCSEQISHSNDNYQFIGDMHDGNYLLPGFGEKLEAED